MSMKQAISNFWSQFSYQPTIENANQLERASHVIVYGMGGSHLAGDILQGFGNHLFIHHDYDLPRLPASIQSQALHIVASYSGNTEEALSALQAIQQAGYPVAVITTGGRLGQLAQEQNLPHIILPDDGIQPRAALGYQLLALSALAGFDTTQNSLQDLADNTWDTEAMAQELVNQTGPKTPLIYSAEAFAGLAYFWKITTNETGKQPAFCNTIPELNHNELAGFDVGPNFAGYRDFHIISLEPTTTPPRHQQRLEQTLAVLERRGITHSRLQPQGETVIEQCLATCHTAMWYAWHLADATGAEPEAVHIIEEFKQALQS